MKTVAGLVVALVCAVAYGDDLAPRSLTFEQRVAAQRAIEQVYWRHRDWPATNPEPKPALAAVMPDDVIRERVDRYLKQTVALEKLWRRPLSSEQLRAEIERMASHTRDSGMLAELFAALGNDPFLIAETLARQTLADRLVRNWYAFDDRFHGELKAKAVAALAACADSGCMKSLGGEYRELVWKLQSDGGPALRSVGGSRVARLDSAAWNEQLTTLARRLGGSPGSLPIGTLTPLEDTRDGFVVTSVLAQSDDELTTADVVWSKTPFDSWWAATSGALDGHPPIVAKPFELPVVAVTDCTDDSWSPTAVDSPDPETDHTAVWTGSEMIVWGYASTANAINRYNPATDSWTALSLVNAPPATYSHGAVWTGTEMIVWGGSDFSQCSNVGGRYNPSTDSWSPTSLGSNVPEPRCSPAAVWTGSEMIVWGGVWEPGNGDPPVLFNSGGRYDPATNSWTSTSLGPNVPTPRIVPRSIWTGSEMIVWGGADGSSHFNSGSRYAPATDTWSSMSDGANVPSPRSYYSVVWTGAEMIVWGGNNGNTLTDTGGRYDPLSDSWSPTNGSGCPTPRSAHTAVWTGSRMIVWGGHDTSSFFNSGGVYDPTTDTWHGTQAGPNVPEQRGYHTAIWTGTEMIVWGGDNSFFALSTGGRYDPATGTWARTSTGTVPVGRSFNAAVWSGTEMIVWGGLPPDRAGGRYLPSLDTWTPTVVAGSPPARWLHSGVWTGTEMIIWGGQDIVSRQAVNNGGRYRPATDTWGPGVGSGGLAARTSHTAVWTGTEMIIWGGNTSTGGRFNPTTGGWVLLPNAIWPLGNIGHSAIWTGTEMIVWGGEYNDIGGSRTTNTGGHYNPVTNQWIQTTFGPDARAGHTAIWTGSEMIVWGGRYYDALGTGARYAPQTGLWTATSTGTGVPAGRVAHSAVWTGTEMVVWGGYQPYERTNTGGRYDPAVDSWRPTSTGLDVPAARDSHDAFWTGDRMLVWGGGGSTGGLYCACRSGLLFFRDADGDGFGNLADSITQCVGTPPAGYVNDSTDCDDSDPLVHPGASERCNGADDDCNAAIDNGGDSLCNDGNVCTNDACGGAAGCAHIGVAGDCDDASLCTTNDSCVDGACIGTPVDGIACDDGDVCTSGDVCNGGACGGTPAEGLACTDGNACTVGDACHGGACIAGAPRVCNDGSVCNGTESCNPATGCVSGAPLHCSDGNACNGAETCNPVTGCAAGPPLVCNDGNACNGFEFCAPAVGCITSNPLTCDDANPCTDDSCAPATGCVFHDNNHACDDANPCTRGDSCAAGACQGTIDDSLACDDGDACTGGDSCVNGTCVRGALIDCDDNNACTADSCDFAVGCIHVLYSPENCDDGNPCTGDACDPAVGCVFPPAAAGTACNDFLSCTGPDRCDGQGSCSGRSVCDDGRQCTDDFADEDNYCVCSYAPTAAGTECNDGSACTLDDACDGTDQCVGGATPDCHDGNDCTEDSCDPALGCVHALSQAGAACSDGDACTSGDACGGAGRCVSGSVVDCDDDNPCTIDSCDPISGCAHVAAPDGTLCDDDNVCTGVEYCEVGTCLSVNQPQCDDRAPCTEDSCDPLLGCLYVPFPSGTSCADTDACNGVERCDGAGLCAPGTPLNCDDGLPCTQDVCQPGTGCSSLPSPAGSTCSDGDVCNGSEVCDGSSVCLPGAPLRCDDGNLCTTDACGPAAGCVFTNNTVACDDGNACTQVDACSGGSCLGSNPVVCAAADQCHDSGACDPASGACSSPVKPDGTACSDNSLCTTGDSCQAGACTPTFSGLNEPNPRTNGWYKRLCHGPHSGDQLTDADALCVASVAQTFAGISTVADICAELEPSQPNNDACDRTDDDLMVLALNICRARVCVAQSIDSQCGGNGNVGQSLTEGDAILGGSSRNATTCAHAKCLAEEVNTGRALEMNTLTLRREAGGVRLLWNQPYLEDGTGHPSKYNVWRRAQGSLTPFARIGTTTTPGFLDTTSGNGAHEYEVTAVMN